MNNQQEDISALSLSSNILPVCNNNNDNNKNTPQLLRDLIRNLVIAKISTKTIRRTTFTSSNNDDISDHYQKTENCTSKNDDTTNNTIFLLDGGTGEELIRTEHVPYDSQIWSVRALLEIQYHTAIYNVHMKFIQYSHAQAITTNTYGIVPGVGYTCHQQIHQYCTIAGRIAQRVVFDYTAMKQNHETTRLPIYVFGSLGPLIESYRSDNILPRKDGIEYYTTIIKALQPYVDAYIAETLSCTEEAIQVLQALYNVILTTNKTTSTTTTTNEANSNYTKPKCNLFISFTVNHLGYVRGGEHVVTAISNVLDYYSTMNNSSIVSINTSCTNNNPIQLLGILFNCSEPEAITKALQHIHDDHNDRGTESLLHRLHYTYNIALGAYANRLIPIPTFIPNNSANDVTEPGLKATTTATLTAGNVQHQDQQQQPQPLRYDLHPEEYYSKYIYDWVQQYNVQLIGGCCGITPEHIRYIHQQFFS